MAGVSRSAVKQAINNDLITAVVEQGGKILIDKNAGLQEYQTNSRRQKKPRPAASTPTATEPVTETSLDLLSWGQAPTQKRKQPASPSSNPPPGEVPPRATSEAVIAAVKAKRETMALQQEEKKLAYIEDMEMAYNAVLLQLTTKAGSLHKQIKAAIPHLTYRELEKIERMISDVFESVATNAFEELPE